MPKRLFVAAGLVVALVGVAALAQATSSGLSGHMPNQGDMGSMMGDGGMGDTGMMTSPDVSEMMQMMSPEMMTHMTEMMGPEAMPQMMSMMSGDGPVGSMPMTDPDMADWADHGDMMTDHHGG